MTQSTLSDAHSQWHQVHGKYKTCPMDCGAGESVEAVFQDDYEAVLEQAAETGRRGIRCGSCKGRHLSAAMVRFCYEVTRDAETFERNSAATEAAIEAGGECEHGLSQFLCVGPSHYPLD